MNILSAEQIEVAKAVVPQGMYCYSRVSDPAFDAERKATGQPYIPGRYVPCPYLETRDDRPEQENGFCRLLGLGDWMVEEGESTGLLWDGCKECGINTPDDKELDAEIAEDMATYAKG